MIDVTKLEKGVKVRYLGGDPSDYGNLTVGNPCVIESLCADGDVNIYDDKHDIWLIGKDAENLDCFEIGDGIKTQPDASSSLYPKYYKDVSDIDSIDVYKTHELFGIDDPSGAIQHASKKLLLSGVRTGGKSKYDDVREARDTLNRWLEINEARAQS